MKIETVYLILGFAGQFCFFMRFFIQWIVSEKNKKSTIPIVFWYFSLGGGVLLLLYAISKKDPVFIVGQSCGFFVYSRNLYLIIREKNRGDQNENSSL